MPTTTAPPADTPAAQLLDVRAVAALLDCSPRHVYRLADAGRMPPPVRLGTLVRWRRQDLAAWLDGGCKPYRTYGNDTVRTQRAGA
jgi:excisionase family DNA binding protein